MNATWDFIGNTWAVRLLQKHLAQQRLRHAYLLTGPPGIGRRTLALRLAQAALCQQPPAPGIPCQSCQNCRQVARQQHPDLNVVQAETVGGVLKVEQVRAVQHALAFKPYQARYRVILFLRFEEANVNAANALLKTLEEPPEYGLLLLTASAPEVLLPTITSRCEVLRLHPARREEIAARLRAQGKSEAEADLLARLAEGRPGYALRLAQDPDTLTFRREKLADLGHLLQASRTERFAYAAELAADQASLRKTLGIWLSFWRDVFLLTSGGQVEPVNVDVRDLLSAAAARVNFSQAGQLVRRTEEAIGLLDAHVNPRLLLENLLLAWPHPI